MLASMATSSTSIAAHTSGGARSRRRLARLDFSACTPKSKAVNSRQSAVPVYKRTQCLHEKSTLTHSTLCVHLTHMSQPQHSRFDMEARSSQQWSSPCIGEAV